jgi:hypothetical protein
MKFFELCAGVVAFASLSIGMRGFITQASADPPPSRIDKPELPRLPTGRELMQKKLKHAQEILEGLSLEDFRKIQNAADELTRISRAGEFLNAHKSVDYQIQTKLFQRTVETLSLRAQQKNLDGVMLAYLDMSMNCVKCHKVTRNPEDL